MILKMKMETPTQTDNRLKDKGWRIKHLYRIKDKKKNLVKFKRNKAQIHFNENKHTRNIILKSRQLGFTTDEAIDCLDDILFTKNFDALFIAHGLEPAKDIFDNKIDLAWENFNENLKVLYTPDKESARKLKIGFGDKTFSSIAVDTSGRSGTFSRIHITEFAKLCKDFPDRAKEVIDGSIPAVPTDGRVDIESTAEESDGLFFEMFWSAWDRGAPQHPTQFKAHFYNWQWDEEIETIQPIENLPKEFREYQMKYNLNDKEISYYYLKYIALGEHERNWATMKKEYPTTPEEAFEGSGNKLFDMEKLGLQKTRLPKEEYNGFKIYKKYILGHHYGIGCDVSEGIGRDSSTIVVWDFSTPRPRIVATYANNNVAADMFAYEIKNLAEKYEQPLVAVERNNHGHTTISKLREIYPERNIYQTDDERFGWLTNLVTKPKMMLELNTAVNEYLIKIISSQIVSEMRRYDKEELREIKNKSETTAHFDLLMAAAIGFQMRRESIKPEKTTSHSTPSWVANKWGKKSP
jgi:hypothetical protein